MIKRWMYLGALLVALLVAGCGDTETEQPTTPEAPAPPSQSVAVADEIPEPSPETKARFDQVMALARDNAWHTQPLGGIMQQVAEQFLGVTYVAGQLDEPETETLIVNFEGFDCVLFIETALAAAQGIAAQEYAYDTFARNLRNLRYRSGQLTDYCSRLHYFSDWIRDNEARGNVRNITRELPGAVKLDKQLNFMTEHRDAYKHLQNNDEYFAEMQRIEEGLKDLELYHVPQARIRETYPMLRAGDLIALTTNIEGLDVTHTGMVYEKPDGSKAFIHASTSGNPGRVRINDDLQQYVEGNRQQIGMMIVRPVE